MQSEGQQGPVLDIEQQWDAIVVGTGMGGATCGYRLAKSGYRVLFCEQGASLLDNPKALRGDYAEQFFVPPAVPDLLHQDTLLAAGRWCDPLEDLSGPVPRRFIPYIGAGSGGSSALYGATLERFHPQDFLSTEHFGETQVDIGRPAWPIDYGTLEPFYCEAERLFCPRGTADPLGERQARLLLDPPPLSPANRELFDLFQARGLHPYRLPIACDFKPGCCLCQGFLCDSGCKHDSGQVCLRPAVRNSGAKVLERCVVLRLEADRRRVNSVVCDYAGERVTLRGALVILAAGALATPVILLRSASPDWPEGLANGSGQVGRNLMRHCIDLHAVKTRAPSRPEDSLKEIGCNDFYVHEGEKLGNVQSFGRLPPASMLVETLQQGLREGRLPLAAALFRLVKPVTGLLLDRTLCRWPVLATTLEDPPLPDNRAFPVGERGIGFQYRLEDHTKKRINRFRGLMADILRGRPHFLIKQAGNNERIAHVCGTCRMGDDPTTSVVDAWGRAHELENLYIADASLFPTSGGTNPALTVAANALRIASHIVENHPRR